MKKQTTTAAWLGGLAAAAAAVFFWKKKDKSASKGRKQPKLKLRTPRPELFPIYKPSPNAGSTTPTPENGHVREVPATNPPADDAGSNFSLQGDVHQPSTTTNNR
ncbi:hypothetical protein GCM10027346_08070 [Hymenobacter seoulensis]